MLTRDDTFFSSINEERPHAEEILEGVILGAQKEYEERKVKFLGNLYANICTNSSVSREHANQLIKTTNDLSFRQFCILQLLKEKQKENEIFKITLRNFMSKHNLEQGDIIIEIRNLQQRGLIALKLRSSDSPYSDHSDPIPLDDIYISNLGIQFCDMLSLEQIGEIELLKVNSTVQIKVD